MPAPPPAPLDKVDELATAALKQHGAMFRSVSEILQWRDTEIPVANHPSLFEGWMEDTEEDLQRLLQLAEHQLAPQEEESLRAVKEIGFSFLSRFLERAGSVGWHRKSPEERVADVRAVLDRPQVPQRTPAWYAQGKEVLTASEFSTLFSSPRAVGQLAMQKTGVELAAATPAAQQTHRMACLTCEMTSLDWGVRFEPVVKQILARRWGAEIVDSGRIMHPTDTRLAASPDGLIVAATDSARVGRLVEIKCPIRREIGKGVPFEYWCQMQIQMEVTGIEECDYVEVKLKSVEKHETDLSGVEAEGFVWLLQHPETLAMTYAYTVQELARLEEGGWSQLEKIPWAVDGFYSVTVPRDRAWFASTAAAREEFWKKVEAARAGTFEVPASTRPRKVPTPAAGKAQQVIVTKEGGELGVQLPPDPACMILDD